MQDVAGLARTYPPAFSPSVRTSRYWRAPLG